MYTFNVPQEVSGSVIEQIKHRAKPVEIPSGPLTPHSGSHNSNPDGAEVSDHSLPVTSTKTDTFDSQALHVSGDGENSDLNTNIYSSHDLPSEEEYDVESKGQFTNADHRDSRFRSNVDQNSSSSDSKHLSESYAERIHQASRAVAANQAVSSGKAGSEQEENYDTNYKVETGGTRHNSNYDGEDRVGEIKPRNGMQDKNADYENISTDDESYTDESYDDSDDELYIDNNNDSGFDVDDEEIREILKDHEAEFTDDNQYISEDISERPKQSVSIPLNSVMDPNEIDDWDPDGTSDYDDADSLNQEHDEDATLEEDEEEKTRLDRYNSNKASFRQQSPSQSSISSFSDDTKEGNDDITDSTRKSLDRPHQDSAEQSGRPAQLPSPRNSFPIPTRYRLPKYSQSFTFAERYKDIYDSNSRRYSRHQQPRSHRHRHHQQQQHHRDSSVPSSELSSGSSGINQYPHTDQTNRNQNLPTNQSSTTHHLSPSRRYDDREEITSALELSSDTNSQDDSLDERQRDVNQHVSRERRLRDREALIAERRKQLEEQRNRYRQRLREYQERLRQRQAEYEASRRQSSGSTEARVTDSRSRERENDRRHQNRHDTLTSEGVTRSSYEHRKNHEHRAHVVTPTPSYPDVRSGPGRSDGGSSRQSYIRSRTEPKTNTQRHGGQDFERRQPSGPREPPSVSRQGEPFAGRSVIENSVPYATSSPTGQASRPYNSGGRATQEFSEGRTDSRIIPRVQQPPRQEVDFPSESRPGVQTQRFTPDIRPSQPQYIPGSPSNPVVISALSGNEVPQVQPTNQFTRDNYIPVNQPLEEELPSGPPDVLPNQIPQNTLSTNQVIRDTVYEWRISGLTECTHSCGGGVQQTVVVCVDTRTQATVTDENCWHLTKPKLLAVPCNKRPCPAVWTPSAWTPCSVTCGRGEQTRTVICQARVSPTLNLTMSNDKCEGQEHIHNRQACENNPCSSWRVGNWSECSVKCGDGERIRKVECVDLENNVVTDDACVELKPDTEQQCNLGECGKGWFFSQWPEECPVECGTGELTRQLFCADEAGAALPESRCNENQRPASTKTCNVDTPCGGQWYTGKWSKCDAICGPGHRKRGVLCIKALPGKVFAIVGEENCAGINKPDEMEACESPPCRPQWYMTSWSQCSQSCGTGYRTREVKCLDPDQKPSGSCPLHTRPKTRDTCNTQSCEDAKAEVENPGCTDKFAQCRVVKRARLCQYGYYKNMCCKSCRGET